VLSDGLWVGSPTTIGTLMAVPRGGKVMGQKLEYIHMNPVKAGLCEHPEDYKYSSARFYLLNEKNWDFLTHIDG